MKTTIKTLPGLNSIAGITLATIFALVLVVIAITCSALLPATTHATVGGPTTVSDFKYSPEDESIYYVVNAENGKGCPPMLYKIGLISEKDEVVYTCEMGYDFLNQEQGSSPETPSVYSGVQSEFEIITNGFKRLQPINLSKNKITIDVTYTGESESNPVGISKNISFAVYQNGTKIDSFATTACSLEQPFIFQGYEIPGFEKKIALLLSAKRNCFEGGYIDESLHIINNMSNLNRQINAQSNVNKTFAPLVPTENSLIVYNNTYSGAISVPEIDTEQTPEVSNAPNALRMPPSSPTDESEPVDIDRDAGTKNASQTTLLIIIAVLLALIAGILIGKMMQKKG